MTTQHTVRVSGVSLQATEHDIRDFFSFSGEIVHVELQRDESWSQVAFVTFQNADALNTAQLLSGATIVDQPVTIIPMQGYVLPSANPREPGEELQGEVYDGTSAVSEGHKGPNAAALNEVLAKGLVFGQNAASQVKQFDEKHGLTATAAATAANVNQKLGITEKFNAGTSAINQQIKAMDEKYQVSGKTKSALAVAEEKANVAGSAIMKNRYFQSGTSWVTGAFSKVAKAAGEVGQKAKDRASGGGAGGGGGPESYYGGGGPEPYGGGYARSNAEPAAISLNSAATTRGYEYESHVHPYPGQSGGGGGGAESTKPPPADGLIL